MAVVQAPPSILARPAGCLVLEVAAASVDAYVRMTKWSAAELPRACNIDMQLFSWNTPPVLAIALLLRLARHESKTYQYWIDAGDPRGNCLLRGLADKQHVCVHVVVEGVARTLRTHNLVRRDALGFVKQLGPQHKGWSREEFEQVCRRLERLYPTGVSLWRAGRADRRRAR